MSTKVDIILDYEKGEKVWIDTNGKFDGPYTVKSYYDNALTRMYSFEETSLCVGVCYVKRTKDQINGKMSDYLWSSIDKFGNQKNLIDNVLDEGYNPDNYSGLQMEGVRNRANNPDLLFFRPNHEMIKWIKEYANGRLVIDVGCGSGRLVESLHWEGCKVMGIEPFGDVSNFSEISMSAIKHNKGMVHFLPKKIEECGKFFQGMGDKIILLFARPCHSDFVSNTLDMKDSNTEALYITVPKNLEKYDDLGIHKERATKVNPKGFSADMEVFYSIF